MITINLPGIPDKQHDKVATIISSALEAVDPEKAVLRGASDVIKEFPDVLVKKNGIRLAAVGKASIAMTAGLVKANILPINAGVAVTKTQFPEISKQFPPFIKILSGGHPVPDENSIHAGNAIQALMRAKTSSELAVALISGGASALVISPAEGITLDDYRKFTQILLGCGADIQELNCFRKHIDNFKGGGLLRWSAPGPVISLILSDVVNNPLDVIASGPTVPDPTTFQDVWKIIEKYSLFGKLPDSIIDHIKLGMQGQIEDTLKTSESLNKQNIIRLVGSNQIAAEAAKSSAERLGFTTKILTTSLIGEAQEAGKWLINRLRTELESSLRRPFCLIAGGETVVTLKGNGLGGRNLETALAAVFGLDGLSDTALITLATDGEDGPTDAAGAVATGETLINALVKGIDPALYLAANDSYHFWERQNGLVKIGSTGTNVNDLAFLFAF